MPAKSMAQFRLMQAARNSSEVRERTGITKKTASEYAQGSPRGLPEHVARSRALRNHRNRSMLKD